MTFPAMRCRIPIRTVSTRDSAGIKPRTRGRFRFKPGRIRVSDRIIRSKGIGIEIITPIEHRVATEEAADDRIVETRTEPANTERGQQVTAVPLLARVIRGAR